MLPYPFPDLIVKEFELRIYLVALFLYRVEYPQVEHIEHVVFHRSKRVFYRVLSRPPRPFILIVVNVFQHLPGPFKIFVCPYQQVDIVYRSPYCSRSQ